MKLYRLDPIGTLDGLKLCNEEEPRPGPREIAIRIRATSLNYRDLKVAAGAYDPRTIKPRPIPLSDGAGEVVEIGPGVTRVKPGDRVAAIFSQRWLAGRADPAYASSVLGGPSDGMLAERVVLSEEGVVPIPTHLNFEEAATLPCAALTAWHALFARGGLTAGETVLTLGTGGVSLFAVQFARLAGARVIVTSGSEEKIARLKAMGVTDVVNYRATPDWERAVLDLTGGEGADHVVELGGAGTFRNSLLALRTGGRLYAIGNLAGEAQINPQMILAKRANVHGISVGSREMFEAMNRAISHARLKPVIDRQFDFGEARAAYDYLASRAHFGKIVIRGA
ncbi:MAG: NAD(P)-dependent alcohol dehydrogenase [Betaproteobacteria bacterium]|nr:NAD(P)-dependent alcohol dehydrogenase [Betaproteobacteria bacterium]MBI2959872.1 NAD(P)-dependent alcohol dehydrogenase [Betaproteobacteria bacterium]